MSRYRDTNLLMAYKPGDMEPEKVRVALLGALRFGKPLVIDNMDLMLEWSKIASYFNSVAPGQCLHISLLLLACVSQVSQLRN